MLCWTFHVFRRRPHSAELTPTESDVYSCVAEIVSLEIASIKSTKITKLCCASVKLYLSDRRHANPLIADVTRCKESHCKVGGRGVYFFLKVLSEMKRESQWLQERRKSAVYQNMLAEKKSRQISCLKLKQLDNSWSSLVRATWNLLKNLNPPLPPVM